MWIDQEIFKQHQNQICTSIWRPTEPMIVMGNGNKANTEVNEQKANQSNVPVLKRKGGGGTVVLYDGCLIVSLGVWLKDRFKNDLYFKLINESILELLHETKSKLNKNQEIKFEQKGISDLCVGEKKFGGTSIFRSRNYLLYQASILYDLDIELINKCLKHPSKEPDYRNNRAHSEFLMGLHQIFEHTTIEEMQTIFESRLKSIVSQKLEEHLISPIPKQFAHLEKLSITN